LIRIITHQQVAIEVGVFDQRRQMGGGGNADRTLDHAADHHLHAVQVGSLNLQQRCTQSAALGELNRRCRRQRR